MCYYSSVTWAPWPKITAIDQFGQATNIQYQSELPLLALWEGNLSLTGGFPSQRASNAKSVSMSWRHRAESSDIIPQKKTALNVTFVLMGRLTYIWGLQCQKQVSQAGISNYIPQFTVGCNYVSLPEIPASATKVLICRGTLDLCVPCGQETGCFPSCYRHLGPVSLRLMTSQFKDIVTLTQKWKTNKTHILLCMGSKFCVKFQRCPLKLHTEFWTHTPQNVHFTRC